MAAGIRTYTIVSNQNNIVLGNVGNIFYRTGTTYVLYDTSKGTQTLLSIPISSFLAGYQLPFFANSVVEFKTLREIWQKVSGNNTNTGWQFVSNDSGFISGPTPTP